MGRQTHRDTGTVAARAARPSSSLNQETATFAPCKPVAWLRLRDPQRERDHPARDRMVLLKYREGSQITRARGYRDGGTHK